MSNRKNVHRSAFRQPEFTGLPVGWNSQSKSSSRIGFVSHLKPPEASELIRYSKAGHLITTSPTGGGKGCGCVIPALLSHIGGSVTIDLKGEAYAVTARWRREMGHSVIAIDPFHVMCKKPDTLNPFSLFDLPGSAPDIDSEQLAELLCGGVPITSSDLFWERNGKAMVTGLIGLANESEDPSQRTIGTVLDYLCGDDIDFGIAKALDTHQFKNQLARQELCCYLQHEGEKCRAGVRSTAQCMVKCLGSEQVRASMATTSFDLSSLLEGAPVDIYVIFPPDKLESHKAVLRLILGTLFAVLSRRTCIPEHRTLLLLDEVAQLGTLQFLRTALTLLRGYGVQVWSMWQDLSQLKHLYPADWESILNNSGVIQAFGIANGWAARPIAEIMDLSPSELLEMGADNQALLLPGERARICRKVNYLTDPQFKGMFDPNPRYRHVR